MSPVSAWPFTPSHGRTIECAPPSAVVTTCLASAAGIAKPTPDEVPEPERMAVFTPIRSPFMSTSGPPELPGLMAASVWMNEETLLEPISERASAETMPLVTVWPTPNGSPIARTMSPTCMSVAASMAIDGSRSAPGSIFSTARSARGSSSSTLAGHSRRSEVTTVISCAASMTWWLVRITPSGRTIEPEPSDWAMRSCGMPPPMNMPQNGSTWVRTTRLENTLTTAGAALRTTGAKESRIAAASAGTWRWSGAGRSADWDLAQEAWASARPSRVRRIGRFMVR